VTDSAKTLLFFIDARQPVHSVKREIRQLTVNNVYGLPGHLLHYANAHTRLPKPSSSASSSSSSGSVRANLPILFADYESVPKRDWSCTIYSEWGRTVGAFQSALRGLDTETALGMHAKLHKPVCSDAVRAWVNVPSSKYADTQSATKRALTVLDRVSVACTHLSTCDCFTKRALQRASLGWIRLYLILPPLLPPPNPWGPLTLPLFTLQSSRVISQARTLLRANAIKSSIDDTSPPTIVALSVHELSKLDSHESFLEELRGTLRSLSPYLAPCCEYILASYDPNRFYDRVLRGAVAIGNTYTDHELYITVSQDQSVRSAMARVITHVVEMPFASARACASVGYACCALLCYLRLCDRIHRNANDCDRIRTKALRATSLGARNVNTWDVYDLEGSESFSDAMAEICGKNVHS